MLNKSLKELITSVGTGEPGSPFEHVLGTLINYRLQIRTITVTWILAILSILMSLFSMYQSNKQFQITNRPYIGLENFIGISMVDSTGLKEGEGTTLNVFNNYIKNYGDLPAYFEIAIPEKKLICVESSINQIMPNQNIELHCERVLGTILQDDQNICDAFLREEIHIRYGRDQNHLDYETVLKMRMDDIPQSPMLKNLVKESVHNGCDGKSTTQNIQWYVASST